MNLSSEIDMIEKYLRKMGKSREVTKILEDFATLNDGSVPVVNKAVKIFRLLASTIDEDGRDLFLNDGKR